MKSGHLIKPCHVALIIDGNGRWAKSKGMSRLEGYHKGAQTVRRIVKEASIGGINYLTLFAFSTENWHRPVEDVAVIMDVFRRYLESEISFFLEHDIQVKSIGDIRSLPNQVQTTLNECRIKTSHCKGMQLILALSYGARKEIVNAARMIAEDVANEKLAVESINEDTFSQYMYGPEIPDPDLLIRTGNESRISNFLLWQLAYSEIIISPVLWPDFDEKKFQDCLRIYSGRTRRYGLTEDQIKEQSAGQSERALYNT